MGNPLFERFGRPAAPVNPINNMSNMLQQFNQFKSQFRGNPKQQVEQLIASGQMTPQQFEQLSSIAQQFQSLFGSK